MLARISVEGKSAFYKHFISMNFSQSDFPNNHYDIEFWSD